MEYPTIKQIDVNSDFKYLWLKYVDGYNLDNHCARCLLGNYSKIIHAKLESTSELVLNEFDSRVYYLCGVSSPYNYYKNFHLAFKYSNGNSISINENGINIEIINAERITIETEIIYNHEKGNKKAFYTCRNWQFAYKQNKE
tara:strand:- start:2800 stop:3225 length:426 start_codon:yes stop_codon:yes gene_type:complete